MIRLGDVVLIGLAAAAIATLAVALWRPAAPAGAVVIRTAEAPARRIPLDTHRRLTVSGRLGESVIVIDHGRVRFVSSPCTGQYCVRRGWLGHAGDFAACLPNGISLTLVTGAPRFDAIAY